MTCEQWRRPTENSQANSPLPVTGSTGSSPVSRHQARPRTCRSENRRPPPATNSLAGRQIAWQHPTVPFGSQRALRLVADLWRAEFESQGLGQTIESVRRYLVRAQAHNFPRKHVDGEHLRLRPSNRGIELATHEVLLAREQSRALVSLGAGRERAPWSETAQADRFINSLLSINCETKEAGSGSNEGMKRGGFGHSFLRWLLVLRRSS